MAEQWEYLVYVDSTAPYIQLISPKGIEHYKPLEYVTSRGGKFQKGFLNGPSTNDVIQYILKDGWEPFQIGQSYHFRRKVVI